jgi:hypothetical protein
VNVPEPSEGMDYKSRRARYGGSPPGRDVRKCDPVLKLAAWRWAVATIGKGVEATFYRQLKGGGRFTARVFEPLVPELNLHFPLEAQAYFGGRDENAAKLIAERVHKMYYGTTDTTKGRGEASPEHPKHWGAPRRSAAEARLLEARWPW